MSHSQRPVIKFYTGSDAVARKKIRDESAECKKLLEEEHAVSGKCLYCEAEE